MSLIYKICPEPLWREAEAAGKFEGAPVDLADGFIHFSTAAQVEATADKHFQGQAGLLLVSVEEGALGEGLRYEPSRGGDLFPHLYNPLSLQAVRAVQRLELGPDGRVIIPSLDGDPPVCFDPAAEGWTTRAETGLMALVGPVWTKRDGEARRYGFVAEARHLNQGGVVHGGMLMAFADQALGMTASGANGGRRQATVQLDTHFLAPVQEGDFVEAHCEVTRQTRSLIFLLCTLTVGERAVAASSGVWKVLGA